jgi:ribosome-binding protein aMBF1 (putative translation factor)
MTIPKISPSADDQSSSDIVSSPSDLTPLGPIVKAQRLVKSKANKKSVKAKRSPTKVKIKAAKAPKAKKPVAKTPKVAKKVKPAVKGATKLNPHGRKHVGPSGSPRGIRQDGKPRTTPGKNKPKSPETKAYGLKVAAARHKKELTQSQLAAKMGISQPGLANIERGVAGASDEMKAKFKKALGL